MDRQPPRTTSNEIDLYIRTYYSLLRSSGKVRVRAFEEAHAFSNSSLHAGARDATPDVAAFAYSAARLPACMPNVERLVAGQSLEQFAAAELDVATWETVVTRGRRRPSRFDGDATLAMFITSASDIDDLVPIVTAYQIEWNKMHVALGSCELGVALADGSADQKRIDAEIGGALGLDDGDLSTLRRALGGDWAKGLGAIARVRLDISLRLLAGTLLEYRRATQRWWQGIESAYRQADAAPRPVYFVSSNTHALCNLLGDYARVNRERILASALANDDEGLEEPIAAARKRGNERELNNLSYYLLRRYINADSATEDERTREVQAFDAQCGIQTLSSPGHIDVNAQLVELAKVDPGRIDPRISVEGIEALAQSSAVIINIDYPLGMAAYHHLSQLAQGVGEIRGVYVMGKAATLNGKVGDVMLSTVAYDVHSENSYLFRNCLTAADVETLDYGTVLDNQKALTVRGSFLQNREYMNVFYKEGYTVLEMEAGPYLSAIYEMVYPKRHPTNEVVHLSNLLPFDFGLIHYASDTPYSRRQSLLSKSLSYFGMDSTYACATAILRRILQRELEHLRAGA